MSKKIMTKNTDKQAIDNLADNFNGYAALLRKIKQRVLVAQQRAIYAANEEMLRMYIIRKSKFPWFPERSVQFSGKRTKRSVQKKGCTQHL